MNKKQLVRISVYFLNILALTSFYSYINMDYSVGYLMGRFFRYLIPISILVLVVGELTAYLTEKGLRIKEEEEFL